MGEESAAAVTRRGFLRGGLGAASGAGAATAATGTAAGQDGDGGGETREVQMTDELVYEPEEITVAPGDTVVWTNVGTVGHSVTAYEDEIPEEAEYFASGGLDSESFARQVYPERGDVPGGEQYEHTFPVAGTYGYFCIPHETVGMVGTVDVIEGGPPDVEPVEPVLSDTARTLGVVVTTAMVAVLSLAYFFMKYGGDYEAP